MRTREAGLTGPTVPQEPSSCSSSSLCMSTDTDAPSPPSTSAAAVAASSARPAGTNHCRLPLLGTRQLSRPQVCSSWRHHLPE